MGLNPHFIPLTTFVVCVCVCMCACVYRPLSVCRDRVDQCRDFGELLVLFNGLQGHLDASYLLPAAEALVMRARALMTFAVGQPSQ